MSRKPGVWAFLTATYLATFAVFEARALRAGTSTYTAWWRRILGLEPQRWWRPIGVAGFLALFTWVIPHITLGVWNIGGSK